jgi:hypothetical protein
VTTSKLLTLVDAGDLRQLFIDQLGWNNPDKPNLQLTINDESYVLKQVAGYRGLRVWRCDQLPDRKVQREIDRLVGKDNLERLVIFVGSDRQEWRWPRRAQGGVNAKLLMHRHVVGEPDTHLDQQLRSIEIDLDEYVTLVGLLSRMRAAFDVEAESASVQAARHMKLLYEELDKSKVGADDATLLLARLLFLLFGDDSGMWKTGLFHDYLVNHTTDRTLHDDLTAVFDVVNTDESNRRLPPGNPLADFRYINGGLFGDPLPLPRLTARFRDGLLSACDFDWQLISPAVFGSMFQTIKDKEARRYGGEHYTTEENILKTICPLFLDDLTERLEAAWGNKGQLTRLHNHLGQLRILDPACGCGNFLVVAYRELRALELELLRRRRDLDELDGTSTGRNRSQLTLDVTKDIQVTLDHFFGIEIEEWPARIAETAMLLVDHLANQRMEEEFGLAPDRLPINLAPTIEHGNALDVAWERILPPSENVIVVGNPPFIGQYTKTPQQKADAKRIWGDRYNGYLDYVTCWYARTLDYYGVHAGRWAFVSTNSICQGEATEYLWRPTLDAGWRCRFAHRSLRWATEAADGAAVHVSIIGFDRMKTPDPVLWTYSLGGTGEGTPHVAKQINPYLVADADIVLVTSQTRPSSSLPAVDYGNKPTDGGNLFVDLEDLPNVQADPIASKYLRRFVGARELIHDIERWCLWLPDASKSELRASAELRTRVAAVKEKRLTSTKAATRAKAATPHLFDERRQPSTSYLAIPAHVGEQRRYFTVARLPPEIICGNANFMVADPNGFAFGVLSSSMFIAWMRAIGGRIKSDLRFSNTFVYNSFPLPPFSKEASGALVDAARLVADTRARYPGRSISSLYEPNEMPSDLVAAHDAVDVVVDGVFGVERGISEDDRQQLLFSLYGKVTGRAPRPAASRSRSR